MVGGGVTPAQALAVVVPLGSHLEIEAMISNRDIAASPLQAGGPAREITPALHKEPESHIRLGTISGIGNAVRFAANTSAFGDPHNYGKPN